MTELAYMNKANYAQHRNCSDSYVSRLGKSKLLVLTPAGLVDVVASDALIAHHRDPARGGKRGVAHAGAMPAAPAQGHTAARSRAGADVLPVSDDNAYREAARRERIAKARIAELELAEKAGELVRREEVSAAVFGLVRKAMDAMDNLADRLSPQLAAEADVNRIHALLTENMRQISGEMAKATAPMVDAVPILATADA